jgi:ABC-type polysaccharide/polyol phosphate export permease
VATSTARGATAPDLRRVGRRPIPELVADGFRELISRQRLIRYLVRANMKRTHSDTVLGQLWWIIDPLFQMAIYFVLVAVIFRRATPDFPLFLFAAILPWKWLSTGLSAATVSVTGREGLIRQLQFPKIVLPAAATLATTVSFIFSLVALALMYVPYVHRLSPWILAIPIIAVVQLVFILAVGMILAALNAFYRDVQNTLGHVVRLWFYVSPALYSVEHISPDSDFRKLLPLNPMTPILESYRDVIWGTDTTGGIAPDWLGLAVVLGFSVLLLVVAMAIFKRAEPAFARIL